MPSDPSTLDTRQENLTQYLAGYKASESLELLVKCAKVVGWALLPVAFETEETLASAMTGAMNASLSDEAIISRFPKFSTLPAATLQAVRDAVPNLVSSCVGMAFQQKLPFKPLVLWGSTARDLGQLWATPEQTFFGQRHVELASLEYDPEWYTGLEARELLGTVVIGPSGSGKSVFIAHQLAKLLKRRTEHRRRQQYNSEQFPEVRIVTVMMKVSEVLAFQRDQAGIPETAAAPSAPDTVLPDAVVAVIRRLTLTSELVPGTLLLVGLDEITAVPGAMNAAQTWLDIAVAVKDAFPALAGVHVAGGGTGVGHENEPFGSDKAIVATVRMPEWTLDMVKAAVAGEGHPMWPAVIDALCCEPHGLLSALTNARMMSIVLRGMSEDAHFFGNAWHNGTVNTAYVRGRRSDFLRNAVQLYISRNGLGSLAAAAMCQDADAATQQRRRSVLRGLGLAALRVTMRQQTSQVQSDHGHQYAAGSDDHDFATAAVHYGLVVSNCVKAGGGVLEGRLPYEMHAGTVLVALNLAGFDVTDVPATPEGLEHLAALMGSVTAACDFVLTRTELNGRNVWKEVPGALRDRPLPCATADTFPALLWDAQTEPVAVAADGGWVATLPAKALSPIIPKPKAEMPDALVFRCLIQCKLTEAATQSPKVANVFKELYKGGLLKHGKRGEHHYPTSVALLDCLLRRWREAQPAATRSADDFAPGRSTLGSRHMYPLGLLLQQGRKVPLCEGQRVHLPSNTPVPAAQPPAAQGTSSTAASCPPPRAQARPTSPPPARPPADALSVPHRDWCEFRFVVTDPDALGLNVEPWKVMNHTLAVFERAATSAAWELRHAHPAPIGQPAQLLSEVLPLLRTDMELTLVAITVCHVCDAKTLRAPSFRPTPLRAPSFPPPAPADLPSAPPLQRGPRPELLA